MQSMHILGYIVKENLIINPELKIQILFERRKFLFINILIFTFFKILYNSKIIT